jgi:TolA-binding protein
MSCVIIDAEEMKKEEREMKKEELVEARNKKKGGTERTNEKTKEVEQMAKRIEEARNQVNLLRRKLKKLDKKLAQLREQREQVYKELRQEEAQLMLSLPAGSTVHYWGYPMDSRFQWIGERTGKVVRTGRKNVLVDFGDKGQWWVSASCLAEGQGKRDEAVAKAAASVGTMLGR